VEPISAMPLSFFDHLSAGCIENESMNFSGDDPCGHYTAQAMMDRQGDGEHVVETRRYLYPTGRVRRIARSLNTGFEEIPIRVEEWSEDGGRRQITSYAGPDEWLWEKVIDPKAGTEKICISRDSFLFFGVPEDLICALEADQFCPEWLLEIRWEAVREAVLGMLGAAKLVPGLPMAAVDRFGLNRLLRMEWQDMWGSPRMAPWCFLELHCTTTGKISYLRVPPIFTDVLSAIAWTFGMNQENYRLKTET